MPNCLRSGRPAPLQANLTPGLHRWRVLPYTWSQGDAAAALLPPALVPPADAAAAGAAAAGTAAAAGEQQPEEAPRGSSGQLPAATAASPLPSPAQPQQPAAAAGNPSASASSSSSLHGCFDVITAADVVYQPGAYHALAATLRALAAPHTLVFLAYKRRGATGC